MLPGESGGVLPGRPGAGLSSGPGAGTPGGAERGLSDEGDGVGTGGADVSLPSRPDGAVPSGGPDVASPGETERGLPHEAGQVGTGRAGVSPSESSVPLPGAPDVPLPNQAGRADVPLPGGGGTVAAERARGGEGPGTSGRTGETLPAREGGVLPDLREMALLGAGVVLPGPLDHERGVLHRVTGFPEWDGFPLREALAGRLGVPVVVDKDTNAAALGLAVGGEGGSFAYLHLGTGLGAGLVIGGSVHRGARTGAGEFGHQVIQLDGPPCTCGDRGCVEALCLDAVARGDLDEAARVLGTGAANLVSLLDIDVVLLGGRTVAAAPEPFVRGVGAVLAERARRTGQDAVPVRLAPGGGRAVAAGAAQLVLGPVFGRGDG
ncbi:ROK family protein [Streptomyces sp. enrichment culture]|uniref:ROK family protein n=1 Tax=Streptomyces sp. enrichment culture TaxID=1795815 RepID=UPI003F5683E9